MHCKNIDYDEKIHIQRAKHFVNHNKINNIVRVPSIKCVFKLVFNNFNEIGRDVPKMLSCMSSYFLSTELLYCNATFLNLLNK